MARRKRLVRTRCEICGPLPPPLVHSICHPYQDASGLWIKKGGCWHSYDEHTDGLLCRTCKTDCSVYVDPTEWHPDVIVHRIPLGPGSDGGKGPKAGER